MTDQPQGAQPLMGGRNTAPLDDHRVDSVMRTFTGLDPDVRTVRFDPARSTAFRVVSAEDSETGEKYGEIVFGPDIYPGTAIANPNASLSMQAAAAHELVHYHRWFDMRQLDGAELLHLDEAMTSIEAIQRYGAKLCPTDIQQLAGDALHRMALYVSGLPGET